MILISGFNVYPNELEDVLVTLPGVLQCAAIGIPDEKSGEAIKVFVVAKPGVTLTKDQIMEHMRANLTGYKSRAAWSSAIHCRPPTSAKSCAVNCVMKS